jgi:protein subunit release factor A
MAKRLSRADRAANQIGDWQSIIDALNGIDKVEEANIVLSKLDWGEAESLKDEIESWRDGLQGTNLENSDKYSELEECVDMLNNVVNIIQDIDCEIEIDIKHKEGATEEEKDEAEKEALEAEIEERVDRIEEAINELEYVSFPGMY